MNFRSRRRSRPHGKLGRPVQRQPRRLSRHPSLTLGFFSLHRWWADHDRGVVVMVGKRKDGDSSDSVTAEDDHKGRLLANTAALLLLVR